MRERAPTQAYFRELETPRFVPIVAKPPLELKEIDFTAFRCREAVTQHSHGICRRVDRERSES